MINNITFSACLIAKNEEKNISKAINSLKQICDQIIVIDTGSTDKTSKIASQLGCEVYFLEWKNDFSLARNFSLQFAKNQWIIILDADEEIDVNSLNENSNLFKNEKIGAIRVIINNYIHQKNIIKQHKYPRIIRNIKGIKFQGKIHEQISESIIQKGYSIADSNIIIHHYGYSQNNIEKINRNLNLLNDEVANNTQDDWKKFHLAETLFTAKKFHEAQIYFQQIINSFQLSNEQNEMVKIRLAQIYISNNDFKPISELLQFNSRNKSIEGLRKYILSSSFILQKDFTKAKQIFDSIANDEKSLLNYQDLAQIQNLFDLIKKAQL